jgi:hypothetical protein
LPDRAGTVRGVIEKIEQREDGSTWACLAVPQWVRSDENLTAGLAYMWAPTASVSLSEVGDHEQLAAVLRTAKAGIAGSTSV